MDAEMPETSTSQHGQSPLTDILEELYSIPSPKKSRLSPWMKYLEDTDSAKQYIYEDNLFDLPEQSVIMDDCQNLIDELDIEEEEESTMLFNLQTIITIYSKNENKKYRMNNGWIPLLGQLILKKQSKLNTYNTFKSIRDIYVPETGTHGFLLRLLILYHDPELCLLIDNQKLALGNHTALWANTLFAGICTQSVIELIWDFLFKQNHSFAFFFLTLSIIIKNRDNIIRMKFETPVKMGTYIEKLPKFINKASIQEHIQSAMYYDKNTPNYFKEKFALFMFGDNRQPKPRIFPQYLPTSAYLVYTNIAESDNESFDYYVVDCRSTQQYSLGRLAAKNSFHIDCQLLNEVDVYLKTSINTIRSSVDASASGDSEPRRVRHITLMGSGLDDDDDTCVNTVAKNFIKKHVKHLSILQLGYSAIHEVARMKQKLNVTLINHDMKKCPICNPTVADDMIEVDTDIQPLSVQAQRRVDDKITRRSTKSKSGVKRTLLRCLSSDCEDEPDSRPSTSSAAENIYGQTSIYGSIGTATGVPSPMSSVLNEALIGKEDLQPEPGFEVVSMKDWINKPNVNIFKCKHVRSVKIIHKSRIIIDDDNFVLLRKILGLKDMFYAIVRCSILHITKITAHKMNENFVTIHFDKPTKNTFIPVESLNILIPESTKFIDVFKQKYNKWIS